MTESSTPAPAVTGRGLADPVEGTDMDMVTPVCAWEGCGRRSLRRGYSICWRCWRVAAEQGCLAEFELPPTRICVICEAPIPESKPRNTVTCSRSCNHKRWSRENAEHKKTEARAWYEANLELTRQRAIAHYAANTEAHRANVRAWQASNPDKRRGHNHDNSARRKVLLADAYVEPINAKAVWDRDEGHCWICREPVDPTLRHPDPRSQSIDHVIPLKLGGLHAMSNAALAHLGCNCSKQDKMPDRFPDWFGRGEEPGAMAPTAA